MIIIHNFVRTFLILFKAFMNVSENVFKRYIVCIVERVISLEFYYGTKA